MTKEVVPVRRSALMDIPLGDPPKFLDDPEITRVINLAGKLWMESRDCRRFEAHRDYAQIQTLFGTGMRVGESSLLQWSDLDAVSHTLVVWTLKKKSPEKRAVPILPELSTVLLQYRYEAQEHCVGKCRCRNDRPFGIHPHRAMERVKRIMLAAGVASEKAHPHIWRHTYAVRAVRAGMNPFVLARLLGHSSVQTTMVYFHLVGVDVRPYLERMGSLSVV